MWKLVVCLALVSGATSARVDPTPNFLYDLEVDAPPAFCKVMKNGEKLTSDGKSTYDLGFSSFTGNIRKDDLVFSVSEVSEYDKFNPITASVDLVSDQLQWPNEVDQVPDGVFEHRVWTVASGFFLAGKDNGSIALIEVEEGHAGHEELVTISPFDEKPWFYHRVMWQDMNRDGHLDAVTARAWGAGDASEESQLIWLENPGDEHISPNWNMHILHEGKVDIAFTFHQLPLDDGTMTNVIVSSGFWSKELALIWSATNDWTDSASIQYMVVDTYGWYFDVEVEDINNDGRMDLLTTTWSQLKSPGAVLAYEIPDDWKTPNAWGPRHILMDGYFEFPIPGKGSPGSAISFWPTEQMKKENHKPYIVVSGDDDGNFFVLTANSDEDTSDWSYTQTKIYQQKVGTVGAMTVADVNEDGYAEIFLPAYQNNFIRVLTYEP